jgi:hypothetical protein
MAIILGVLNLFDFVYVKREEYGKVKLQLQKKVRHWNHDKIKKIQKIPKTKHGSGSLKKEILFLMIIDSRSGNLFKLS